MTTKFHTLYVLADCYAVDNSGFALGTQDARTIVVNPKHIVSLDTAPGGKQRKPTDAAGAFYDASVVELSSGLRFVTFAGDPTTLWFLMQVR